MTNAPPTLQNSAAVTTAAAPNNELSVAHADVVLVCDASPAPGNWVANVMRFLSTLMLEYITNKGQPPMKVRVGLITYGRAPSPGGIGRASPLISQIPFTDAEVIMSALKSQHGHLDIGIGTATSAGGMAVLEALVAAIEMCEAATPRPIDSRILAKRTNISKSVPPRAAPSFHIALFAHSQPNTSAPAQFNLQPEFDELTWDALPDELKKRKIHFHMDLSAPSPSPALAVLHRKAAFLPMDTGRSDPPASHTYYFAGPPKKALAQGLAISVPTENVKKRPFTAVDNASASTPPNATNTSSPAPTPASGSSTPSPNKRMKTNHEPSHPPASQGKSAPPGRLAIPQFDLKQASEAAAAAVANKASGASGHGATNPAHAQAEYRAMIQRQQQQQAQNAAAALSSPDPPVSPEHAKATAQNARGKAGAPGHQRQLSQGRPQNPAAQQPTNFVPPQKPSTSSNPTNPNPTQAPLNPAQLLIVSQQMQAQRQNQALQQAAAQQAHLRRPGIAGPAGQAVGGPGLAQAQALAQQAAAQRIAAAQQLQAGMLAQGTASRSPTQPLGARPPQAQGQPQSSTPQSQQSQYGSQKATPNPTSNASPPTPQQSQQAQRAPGPPTPITKEQVTQQFERMYREQIATLRQKGVPDQQIKMFMEQWVTRFKIHQQQLHQRNMAAAAANGAGAGPSQAPTPQQQQQHQTPLAPAPQIRPPQAQPQAAPSAAQRQWAGTIKWPYTDPATRQPRIIDAHIVCTPVTNGQQSVRSPKFELWPSHYDLSKAKTLSQMTIALQERIAKSGVPLVAITPQQEGAPPSNEARFLALAGLLQGKNMTATLEAQFTGMPASNRGLILFAAPGQNGRLFAAVYIDEDLPVLPQPQRPAQPNASGVNLSNLSPQQLAMARQIMMAQHQQQQNQQTPTNNAMQNQAYMQMLMQQQIRNQQLQQQRQQQAQAAAGQNGMMQHQQAQAQQGAAGMNANALGFNPGGAAFNPGARAGFSANPEMTAQLQALQQQSQQQQRGFAGQQQPNFLNLGGGGGGQLDLSALGLLGPK